MNVVKIDTIKDATIYVSTQKAKELLATGQSKPRTPTDNNNNTDIVHELILGEETTNA